MSTNIGNLSVGLGYDLSALERGGAEAFRTVSTQTQGLSAEMKRNAREGSESFRLIDEALGIHVSRPLTRIIGQTQTLGPILASAFQFSAIAAIGVVIAEQGKKLFEITGATEAWKDLLGLSGESAEQAAKRITAGDEAIIKSLRQKTEMQMVYNDLVLGLKGGDLEKKHLELLKEETAEIQKQIALQMAAVSRAANDTGWRTSPGVGMSGLGVLLSMFGQGPDKAVMEAQSAANKLAGAMKPLVDRLKELQQEMQKTQWKIFRDGADESAKAAKAAHDEMVHFFQLDTSDWNRAANLLFEVADMMETLPTSGRKLSDFALPAPGQQAGLFPTLSDAKELQKVTDDNDEAWSKAGEILQQIESPLDKYNTGIETLTVLLNKGAISSGQFTAAQQMLQEQLSSSENKLETMLKSGGALNGLQAFLLQIKGEGTKGSDAQATFDMLNKGMTGFEDATVRALTGAKGAWRGFFLELDQMVLKFFLNKMFSSLLGGLGGLFGGLGGSADVTYGSALPASGGLSLSTFGAINGVPGFASGTDSAPGGLAWVGEKGPELMNVPGGSSITPAGMLRGGVNLGGIHIDAKGAEIGVEEKIARALSASLPHMVMRAVVESAEVQRRTPH